MASLTITVPDAIAVRVWAAVVDGQSYVDPNLSKINQVKQVLRKYIGNRLAEHEARTAATAASEAAETTAQAAAASIT